MTAIEVTDLVAGYPGRTVLHEVTARFPAGMVTAVTGPNGSGKSTLLAVLAGVIAPSSGSVTRRHAHRPAFVTQRSEAPDTLPITVGETVAMGRWAHLGPWRRPSAHDRAVVDACLTRLDIAGLAARPRPEIGLAGQLPPARASRTCTVKQYDRYLHRPASLVPRSFSGPDAARPTRPAPPRRPPPGPPPGSAGPPAGCRGSRAGVRRPWPADVRPCPRTRSCRRA